jgi:hypothetical protein
MNITLTVVVTAIVVLIVALVVITIFGSSIANVATIADAKSFCRSQGVVSCQVAGTVPATWDTATVRVNGVLMKCSTLTCPDCECLLAPEGGPSIPGP